MQYGLIGEDASTDGEKLQKYTGEVDWSYLRPHYENEALYFVDPELGLAEAGLAFTQDEKEKVARWLKAGDLVQIGALHAAQWEDSPTKFEALVVSPFVLCRPLLK